MASLSGRAVRCVLLDITGVLYNSSTAGDGEAIPGSADAVRRLLSAPNLEVRFCSNESVCDRNHLIAKLTRLGFSGLTLENLYTPAPAVSAYMKAEGLRPHLLVKQEVESEFLDNADRSNPNCVVIGDAAHAFSYENMNAAFNSLMRMEKPLILSMGMGKYYRDVGGLMLDLGAYTKALQYATSAEVIVIGKPDRRYFDMVLQSAGSSPHDTVMIGDDLFGDVAGAQANGMRGVQVRTGKFRPEWENHKEIKPDAIYDNLAAAVTDLLK